ncbi:MAG: geranylgeranylglycerol-phosphate geranylgeranyltransferase [Fibrobacterota bacterium]
MTAYWNMVRPANCGIAALSVGLGFYTVRGPADPWPGILLYLLMASAFLMAGFGNVVNDLLDLDTDAVNRPGRPLPSGRANVRRAFWLSNLLCLSGLACARAAGVSFFFMAAAVGALLWLYNARLKRTVLYGNIAVSFLCGFTLLYGGALAVNWHRALWPALLAFLLNLAREIVKDMADVPGDRASGCGTLPVRYGTLWAANAAAGVLLLLIFLIPRAYLSGAYDGRYLIIAEFGVALPSLIVIFLLFRHRDNVRWLHRLSVALKTLMLLGLIAVLMGKGSAL